MHIRIVHLALVVLMACSAATPAGELLVNGGFESGQTGWSKWGPNAQIVSDPGYFRLSASAVTYWVDSGWVQTVPAGAGDSFTLSGEMIYPNRTDGQMIHIPHRSTGRFYHLEFL